MKVLIFLVIASCPKVIRGQILRFDFNKTSVFNHIITIFCVALKMWQYFYVVVLLHVIIFSPKCFSGQ